MTPLFASHLIPLVSAALSPTQSDTLRIRAAIWIVVIIVLAVSLLVGLIYIRKRLLQHSRSQDSMASIVEELRQLKDAGKLSESEYQQARAKWVSNIKSSSLGSPRKSQSTGRAKAAGSEPTPSTDSPSATPDRNEKILRAKPGFDLTGAPLPKSSLNANTDQPD